MFNILIAEDDYHLNRLIYHNLSEKGFNVVACYNGKEALAFLESQKADLLITDIMMPETDGVALVKQLKKEQPDFPVIILTALEAIEDKKICFECGADDYIVKPVDFEELLLRINALLRRYRFVTLKDISHKEIDLNYIGKRLTINRAPVELTKKEFLLLYMLMSSPGKIFSRTQILDEVWGYETESFERTVDVHINKLREKLSGCSVEIVTVRGLGYKAVLN